MILGRSAGMTYQEVLTAAGTVFSSYCKACPVCNGKACKNRVPGPGAKGVGDVAIRNYEKWQEIRVNMDTLTENAPADTSCTIFGKTFRYPIFAGPVGAVKLHYGPRYTDMEYNDILVPACRDAGIAAFTGDGSDPHVMEAAAAAIEKNEGFGIPTVKPWNKETVDEKLKLIKKSGAFAAAMDIDAAGLPFLRNLTPPAGRKSVGQLREIIDVFRARSIPFIVKGIMTVRGAKKAIEAGASGIVVSNHGGRVQDQCPATAEVLKEIADAVRAEAPEVKILVDGGLRSGVDIFKALALGADAVLIARPYVTVVYGGGAEGVSILTEKLGQELADTMSMCGASKLSDITADMLWRNGN